MFTKYKHLLLGAILVVFSINYIYSQELSSKDNKKLYNKLTFYDYRGTNTIDAAIGSSVINGDLPNPEFEIYFKIGYKRFITEHINLNFTYNKYNLAFKDVFSEGFMSFDFNLEYMLMPFDRFSPYIYAGVGYNAANYFETTSTKAQGAIGLEYIVTDGVGVKLFSEYNYNFGDELDGVIGGDSDDTFFRIGVGVNVYFGGSKRKEKLLSEIDTVIKSNLVK